MQLFIIAMFLLVLQLFIIAMFLQNFVKILLPHIYYRSDFLKKKMKQKINSFKVIEISIDFFFAIA